MSDARNVAWLAAWERLEAASKLKSDCLGKAIEPVPEWYWATLAEAAIFAELAKAPMEVGLSTGDWLDERNRQDARLEELFKKVTS